MNMMPIHSGWTDERIERLTKLWTDGLSASQIARQLGGVTRNAVIGKVSRLGLGGRATPAKPQKAVRVTAPRRPAALRLAGNGAIFEEPVARLPRIELPQANDEPGVRTVMTLGAFECRWPIGDPAADDFTFCGAPHCVGAYCGPHARRAYDQAAKRKPDSAELARSLRRYV